MLDSLSANTLFGSANFTDLVDVIFSVYLIKSLFLLRVALWEYVVLFADVNRLAILADRNVYIAAL